MRGFTVAVERELAFELADDHLATGIAQQLHDQINEVIERFNARPVYARTACNRGERGKQLYEDVFIAEELREELGG